MKEQIDVRELTHSTVPVVLAVLLLATGSWWERWLVVDVPVGRSPLLFLASIAVIAALWVPGGRRTLALGSVVLPLAIWFHGIAWAGGLAAGAYFLRELLRRFLFGVPLRQGGSIGLLPTTTDAARVCLATLAAGTVWVGGLPTDLETVTARLVLGWALVAALAYAAALLLLQLIENRWLLRQRSLLDVEELKSAGLDVAGWLTGAVAVGVVASVGWFPTLSILAVLSLLAAETARNVYLRRRAVARISELWDVTRAGHRIIFRDPDVATMAGHVLEECRNVLSFFWFQFELLETDEETRSWWAGPDGQIEEGVPEPADSPPALPGIHRRTSWRVIERDLEADGNVIARLRFWCDPRRIESTSVELLDSLLPQVAASVHRALLDRRAKQDPLTGLADRRVLENRLEQSFTETRREGGSMAVIMCDLDRFKKINDKYGHDVGDRALLQVVTVLEEHRRDADICCRFGGEEFALVLEETDGDTALRIAERLRIEVERTVFKADGVRIPLKLSAGVAAYPALHVKTGKELLLLADAALLEAKGRGRNRSLLHLGRERFRGADGKVLENDEPPAVVEAPTLFA